jgi:hypothetical protein
MVVEDASNPLQHSFVVHEPWSCLGNSVALSWTQSTTSNYREVVTLSCDALYLVHDYLSQMLYESDGCGKCLYEYVEPIPLPPDVTYI